MEIDLSNRIKQREYFFVTKGGAGQSAREFLREQTPFLVQGDSATKLKTYRDNYHYSNVKTVDDRKRLQSIDSLLKLKPPGAKKVPAINK